ncbi:glycosyltransferase, partial [Mangrovimonas sp. AS39]|uniref:glycosyltransferase family 2 protein n=1 Tax=Mangrovimonas futianensis TaxID=2895523 RepID=UPI001E5D6124
GISVIIPTYNKFNRLELVLKTLLKQNVSEINAEIIIVDQSNINAERLLKNIPNSKEGIVIRYFKQKGAGISRAKNFGLTNANYKLAVFIDDDIT